MVLNCKKIERGDRMKKYMASGIAGLMLLSAQAGLTTWFDFESKAAPVESLKDAGGKPFFVRFRENTSSKQTPTLAADTPGALAGRSKSAVNVNRGLIWLKGLQGEMLPFGGDFTVNFWFKSPAAPTAPVWFFTANKSFRLGYTPSNSRFYFQNLDNKDREYSLVTPFPAEGWNMLTLTWKSGALNFYLNGKNIGARTLKSAIADSPEIFLGNSAAHGKDYFDGLIDDFAVWSQVLTAEEITALFAGKAPVTIANADAGPGDRLTRIVTEPFPADFKAYEPVRSFALVRDGKPDAVIVRGDRADPAGTAEKLQKFLAEKWQLNFPVVSAADALKSGKPMIFWGKTNGNMPLRRLAANLQVLGRQTGSEMRILPDALDWKVGVVYCGGNTPEEVMKSAAALVERCPDPSKLTFAIVCEKFKAAKAPAGFTAKQIEIMREHYRNPPDYIPNQSAIWLFRDSAQGFRSTGDPEYARAFAELQKIYLENYDRAINARGTPPSFTFHEYPFMLGTIEQSEAFTAEDRARAAEIVRRAVEHCMDYWEMREPMDNYARGLKPYYTNHPIFASRSVYFGAEYLLRHYGFEPARYQMAVAANALEGIAPHPIGPEDSAAYQYICYRLFIDYALGSGKYSIDFFNNPAFKNYIRYAKLQLNHLGTTSSYGDNPPLALSKNFPTLGYALDIFGDEEAESLLSLIRRNSPSDTFEVRTIAALGIPADLEVKMPADSLGLNFFELDRFRLDLRKAKKFNLPVLDKAFYRSGWGEDADFLATSGISGAPHGHQDANGILVYLAGRHYFLVEGDYVRGNPEEHNTVTLRENGVTVRPKRSNNGCFAQIAATAQTPSRRMSAVATRVEDYGTTDWTRTVCYEAGLGFWTLDEIKVKVPGEFLAECRWRSLGEFGKIGPQTVEIVQKKADPANDRHAFSVVEGSGAERRTSTQFDHGHSGKDGYYAAYKYAETPNTRVITQSRGGNLKPGETIRFVNYCLPHAPAGASVPEIRQLADNAYAAIAPDAVRLAVFGKFSADGIEIDADYCFVGPEGLVALNARRLRIGGHDQTYAKPENVAFDQASDAVAAIRQAAAAGKVIAAAEAEAPKTAAVEPLRKVELSGVATALAAAPDGSFGIGCADGKFIVVDADGKTVAEAGFSGGVTAAGAIPLPDGKTAWAVGEFPSAGNADRGALHLIDATGKILWSKTFTPYQARNGRVTTVFPARFAANGAPVVVAGDEGWHYRAFGLDGSERWKRQVYHGATVGAAADLDGDGIDEVVAGIEYFYHQLLDKDGKMIIQKNTDPMTSAIAIADLDGDGKNEALCGRLDNTVYVMAPTQERMDRFAPLPLGGPIVGIEPFEAPGKVKFAVAEANGRITFASGEMKAVSDVDFGVALHGLTRLGGDLLAAAGNGLVYRVDSAGKITAAYRCGYDPNAVNPPPPVTAKDRAAVVSGRTLYLIQ
jgi:hypothetical protein